ncbi:MAG: AI-2E family transporter [Deltaproteobacteria bacterium]|nr:AI-2E family transporter [Deltaproteobacteria bacterium]
MSEDPTDPDDAASTRRRRLFLGTSAVVVTALLVAFRAVLLPFVLGAVLAYVLHPLVTWVERLHVGGRRAPRWAVVVVLYALLLTGLTVGIVNAIPPLAQQVRVFIVQEVPSLRREVERRWVPTIRAWSARVAGTSVGSGSGSGGSSAGGELTLPANPASAELQALQRRLRTLGEGHAGDIVGVAGGIIGGIIGGVFRFFMTLMVSAYLLVTEERVFAFFRSLVRPRSRRSFDELLGRLDRGLSGVVRGQLLICMVNGMLSAVGFALAGLKAWPILALVAGVMSIVPIFGSIMSSVPAVAIGLTQSFGTALFVLLWIVGIHQVEANLLNPKIMGDAARTHPVLVVLSLLAGEHFFGILGALLAVPTLSILQTVFLHWKKHALPWDRGQDSMPPPPP